MGAMVIWCQFNSPVLFTRERIPHKNVFYYRCPDHQKNYVLSFAFAFDREDDVYQVSRLHWGNRLANSHSPSISFSVCLLLSIHVHTTTALPGGARQTESGLLQEGIAVPQRGTI